jgi:hypothetical protein
LIQAPSKLNITGDIDGLLDKIIQDIFFVEMGNQSITDCFIQITKEMASDPGIDFIGFISELENKHLEFRGVFVYSSLDSLTDDFRAFNEIDLTMDDQMLFLEYFEEIFERRERFDVFVRVDVSYFRTIAESDYSKTDLFVGGDFSEFHILFHSEDPGDDGGNRCVLSVELIRLGDLHCFGYS